MTNFIPIFPLGIVVFPGEQLNLHIFEPRYKQLIHECFEAKKPFGIPSVINDKINEMGTVVEVTEISKEYEDGKMDIKTKGLQVFRMLEMINTLPDKLYSGAIVSYPDNDEKGNRALMQGIVNGIKELHKLLNIEKKFAKPDNELWSYDVAHHAGLSLQEEYELLELLQELQRQEYLKRHLKKVIPVLAEMETLKEKVKLNGHFKNLKGL
ncbi:MAG TPA: LON peptidase substrate-binding domain-containing protein [Ferruginibacter sp.]|nr:LON peptidase substrate-binding domain-containing protein [Ferruginibacter sp.]